MDSFIEPLYKARDLIKFGWSRESGAASYKVYVGIFPGTATLSLLADGIPDVASAQPVGRGKVIYDATIEDVRTLLSLATTVNFTNRIFYFAITYIDSVGSESALADSTIVEVFPVGILPKRMKDDPTMRRHPFVYNDGITRWVKQAGSERGAIITDPSNYYATNVTTEYTYDGTNISTEKSYLNDATSAGSPAKLKTYTFVGSLVTKIEITDTTV